MRNPAMANGSRPGRRDVNTGGDKPVTTPNQAAPRPHAFAHIVVDPDRDELGRVMLFSVRLRRADLQEAFLERWIRMPNHDRAKAIEKIAAYFDGSLKPLDAPEAWGELERVIELWEDAVRGLGATGALLALLLESFHERMEALVRESKELQRDLARLERFKSKRAATAAA